MAEKGIVLAMEQKKYRAVITVTVDYTTYEHNARYVAHDLKDSAIDGVSEFYLGEGNSDASVTGTVSYEGV